METIAAGACQMAAFQRAGPIMKGSFMTPNARATPLAETAQRSFAEQRKAPPRMPRTKGTRAAKTTGSVPTAAPNMTRISKFLGNRTAISLLLLFGTALFGCRMGSDDGGRRTNVISREHAMQIATNKFSQI